MTHRIDRLLEIMTRLRDPRRGCPWDREQDFASIAPYTIEEAYEVAEAVDQADMTALKNELGDLLFQVVFHAEMAREAGHFSFDDVAAAISEKMERRHPHVFGDARIEDAESQTRAWEAHKAAERDAEAVATGQTTSALAGVPKALPALTRSRKLQDRAARVGFDWPDAAAVWDKIDEERAELEAEMSAGGGHARLLDELGDVLFGYVNLARHLGVEPETALRATNAKFERRFRHIEAVLAKRGETAEDASFEELDRLWNQARAEEAG